MNYVEVSIKGLEENIKKYEEKLITTTCNSKRTSRKIVKIYLTKPKREEKQLYRFFNQQIG